MTKRQLNLAGWLSIANAVLLAVSFTMTVLATLLAKFATGDGFVIVFVIAFTLTLIIPMIRHGFYLYTFYCLKKILNSRFQFRDADQFISQLLRLNRLPFALVALNITLVLTLGLIGRIRGFGKFEVEAMGWILGGSLVLYWLAMILTGIFYMLTGVEISRLCRNRRKEVLGAFSQSLTITGWLLASLFLAPLGFLFAVQADVLLGSIFFNIARES
jgi:hypothetical protein